MKVYRVQVWDGAGWLSVWHGDGAPCVVCHESMPYRPRARMLVHGCLFARDVAEREVAERSRLQPARMQFVREIP